MDNSRVSGYFEIPSAGGETHDEETGGDLEVPCRSTLDGFAAEVVKKPGIGLRGLEPLSRVEVQTANTLYQLTILDPHEATILIQGGHHFREAAEVRLCGSSFGGSLLKLRWIGCGMHLEVMTHDTKVVTSQIQSVTVRDTDDLPGPF